MGGTLGTVDSIHYMNSKVNWSGCSLQNETIWAHWAFI